MTGRTNRGSQPPLVESGACLCRVEAGLKAAKLGGPCRQSGSVRVAARQERGQGSSQRRGQKALLPGLPDDLAIACLARVPRAAHGRLRQVCRRWNRLLAGNYFYSVRRAAGRAEEWVYAIKRDGEGRISWAALDPAWGRWAALPPVPAEFSAAVGFGCAVLSGCHLYLLGGKHPLRGPMRRVVFYSARTNKWHRAPDMLRRRHCFGFCVIGNRLYVAGGDGEAGGGGAGAALRSVEVYDPNRNRWALAAEMGSGMVPFIGVVYGGRWLLKGLGERQQVLSEAYRPEADAWAPAGGGLVAGWRNPSTCLGGRLYALGCRDGCRLRVYDEGADAWTSHSDSGAHLGGSRAVEAAALLPLAGNLCIVRNDMSVSLVDLRARRWETIAGKGGPFRTLVANLWSNLAARSRLNSHIVHCQVLQA
ncbi:F-box/kelch-repeat protein At1g55270-like [Wolffia australiana]